ncbi:MAG: DUF86 domain-containing protein [Patescibacteria group bacterium]|jgi:uncharacterized protein with HEPN domain
MKINRDRLNLLHIRDSVTQVIKYTQGISFEDFKRGDKDYDAILMRIIVIGEAINDLSNEFKEKHSDLPWHKAVGLRNRIAHGYVTVEPEVIWQTITEDFPEFKNQLEKLLK